MPSFVQKETEGDRGGIWQVRWTWMPWFLAANKNLVKAVDERLNQLFAEGMVPRDGVLDKAVIDTIVSHFPMTGLKEALEALLKVDPTISLSLVDEVGVTEKAEIAFGERKSTASSTNDGRPSSNDGRSDT